MSSLKPITIDLKELVSEIYNGRNAEEHRDLFLEMAERAHSYRLVHTDTITKDEESKFEKKYSVMNNQNIVLYYTEIYRIVDEKLRNRPPSIYAEEIAAATVELENIVIQIYSEKPLGDFKQDYLNLLCGFKNNLE